MATPERDPAERRDPFENLRLDEGFVRAARFIEPSAAERGHPGDRHDSGRTRVVPANRRISAGMHRMVWAPRPSRRRRATRAFAVIAVLAGMISIVIALRHTTNRIASPARGGSGGSGAGSVATTPVVAIHQAGGVQISPALLTTLKVGDCVSWDPSSAAGSSAATTVSCSGPHRAEVIKLVNVASRLPEHTWPPPATLEAIAETECAHAFTDYAKSAKSGVVPYAGVLEPTAAAWSIGVKQLACTAQLGNVALITGRLGPVPSAT